MKKVAIIGAGPAGCSAAYHLKNEDIEIHIFEKEDFIGGRTHRYKTDDVGLDTGAAFFTNFYPLLNQLVGDLGIKDEVIALERRVGMRYKNVLAEFTFGDFSTFWNLPFLTTKDKLVMIWNTLVLTLKRPFLDLVNPQKLAKVDDESIADWARNTMTDNIYAYCIKPGVEPFWYFSCEDVSRAMTTVLQANAADAKFFTFKYGMSRICEKMLNDVNVHMSSQIISVNKKGDCYVLDYSQKGNHYKEDFDAVILSCPATVTRKILDMDLLDNKLSEFVNSQQYVSNIHACYIVDHELVKDLFAYYYPCGHWDTPIGAIVLHRNKCFESVKAPENKELISVYLLDKASMELADETEEDIMKKVWELACEFEEDLPKDVEPVALFNRKEAIPLHEVGRFKKAKEVMDLQSGNLLLAGDYLSCPTEEGALRSGRWAANKLLG